MSADIDYRWRSAITDDDLFALTRSYGGNAEVGWWDRIRPHSLGWATAHLADGAVVGFVNVAWDGADHAFLLDTKTRPDHQRRGIATNLVRLATHHAKLAGCEWLHVDFEDADRLAGLYFSACGFRPTTAGLIHLPDVGNEAPLLERGNDRYSAVIDLIGGAVGTLDADDETG